MYIAIYPSLLVYGLYACENIDNCERPVTKLYPLIGQSK